MPTALLEVPCVASPDAAKSDNRLDGGPFVHRRGNLRQGRALESLGHAVEYLVDSRLFQSGAHSQRDEDEAIQILMRLSRAVFAECPEVVSLRRRFRAWVGERIGGQPNTPAQS